MKGVQFKEYGGPEVLQVVDVEEPHAGPGQIRIAVRAAAVNPSDYKTRAGNFRDFRPLDLPTGLGAEGAGIVDEVGEGVTGTAVGDAVFGLGSKMFAEYAVLDVWAHKPSKTTFEEAAALSSAAETTFRLLELVGAKAGQTILVSGAAGGVGTALVQLARRRGMTVIGTSSEAKHDYLRSIGAVPTTYGPGLVGRVKALAPAGVDAAFDVVGTDITADLVEITGDPSKVVTILLSEAKKDGIQSTFGRGPNADQALAEVAQAIEEGVFRMRVDRTFPLDKVGEAQSVSADGHVTGKLVVVVS